MKRILLFFLYVGMVFNQPAILCAQDKPENQVIQTTPKNAGSAFYIISINGTTDKKQAIEQVKTLKTAGHPAGYLWIADFQSLSGKKAYAVFIGPFVLMDSCVKYLLQYKKESKNAYAVKVHNFKDRLVIFDKYDIRVNGVRQMLLLTYSTPEDEEAYAEEGGEDWGWFVNDVFTYFDKKHKKQVFMGSVYGSWFTKKDIKKLVDELSLEGFGYLLIKGSEKTFIHHSPPDEVIGSACDFFGLEYDPNWQD